MPAVRVPPNVSSITITGPGALTPNGAQEIDVTDMAVLAALLAPEAQPNDVKTHATTGVVTLKMCSLVTSITINSVVHAVGGTTPGETDAGVDAAQASIVALHGFKYVRAVT